MGEVADAYAGCRRRIAQLTEGLDDSAVAVRVPACPRWSVHDVVAHVSGVVDDALAGRLEGVATDPWTAAQVDARRGRPVADMLAGWHEQAPAFEEMLEDIGDPGRQAVADVVTHEHDIRGALERPGARDSDAVGVGLSFVGARFTADVAPSHGLSVRVEAADGATYGDDDAAVVLRGASFELLRAMTGRRTVEQIRAMDWSGAVDLDRLVPVFTFGPFRPTLEIVEK